MVQMYKVKQQNTNTLDICLWKVSWEDIVRILVKTVRLLMSLLVKVLIWYIQGKKDMRKGDMSIDIVTFSYLLKKISSMKGKPW